MIGPSIPENLLKGKAKQVEDDESSDDDYGPALPPDMQKNPEPAPEKRVIGPSFPTGPPPADESDEDDDVGPMPLPEGYVAPETSGIQDFLEQEERRRKAIEVRTAGPILRTALLRNTLHYKEDGKPKAVKREEWMLAPPESSGILGSACKFPVMKTIP